jgi:hypothetical protein
MVYLSLTPLMEYQADVLSFGFRPKRSAIQLIAFLFARLVKSVATGRNEGAFLKKVSQQEYAKYKGKKSRFRGIHLINNKRRQKRYDYTYWVYIDSKYKVGPDSCAYICTSYYKIINIDIVKCFDTFCHDEVLSTVPLSSKYKRLLKSWLTAPLITASTPLSKIIKEMPTRGVLQKSFIGLICCNFVCDGLQDHMEQALKQSVFRFTEKEITFLTKKLGTNSTYKRINHPVKVFCMRYVDDILVFGKFSWCQARSLQSALEIFLIGRGLKIKDSRSKTFIAFKPGTSFKYLGFK